MKRFSPVLLLVAASLNGCTYLTFHNTPAEDDTATYRSGQWHHATLYGSLELSRPVDTNQLCQGGDWQTIRTEHSALAVPASAAMWPFFGPSVLSMGAWTPSRIVVECRGHAGSKQ
ncbi:hypothetical protein [Saccharospirillum mangrovi]|uniref:hypothetical protein n=1 Tax=Saccharospirillum mangrovi TaxID=2161747 RepID=UPI000D3B44DD|nr:hypothetical protein [Saccharospirillum mangrovi]